MKYRCLPTYKALLRSCWSAVVRRLPSLWVCVLTASPLWTPTVPTGTSVIVAAISTLNQRTSRMIFHSSNSSHPSCCTWTRSTPACTLSSLSILMINTSSQMLTDVLPLHGEVTPPTSMIRPASEFTTITRRVNTITLLVCDNSQICFIQESPAIANKPERCFAIVARFI